MELAVALPVLAILLVGTIDFGRVFRLAMIVQNAARAGALFGAQSSANAANTPGMRTARDNVLTANGLSTTGMADPARTCECATDAGTYSSTLPIANNCGSTAACAVGSHLIVNVTVTATQTFSMTGTFPGLPTNVTIARTAKMRVLN